MKVLFIFIALLSCHPLLALSQKMLTINSNDDITTFIYLHTDSTNFKATFFEKKDFNSKGDLIDTKMHPLEELSSEKGMILKERGQHVVVTLRSKKFDPRVGGEIILDTLYNGITGSRQQYKIRVLRPEKGWLVQANNKEVNHMQMLVKRVFLIGTVGISNVIMTKR